MGKSTFSGPVNSEAGFEVAGVAISAVTAQSDITSLTDNSGGTANDTIAVLTDASTAGSADLAPVQDAVADLAAKVNEILVALRDAGILE